MRTTLIDAGLIAVPVLLVATSLAVAVFLRLTSGARGLRGRVQRLFRLPERVRPLSKGHYYHAYWETR